MPRLLAYPIVSYRIVMNVQIKVALLQRNGTVQWV